MEKKLSLQDYENFYRNALLGRQQVHQNVPRTLSRLSKFQNICRVCGSSDDGHFVDLDKYQEFEFEPTISSYRQLFRRTSLQFQFSTMPDLPGRICGICAYKAKIFFLLTRQFMIGQQIMRTAVTDFYRDNYGIEPPEQLEDLLMLRKQLESVSKVKIRPLKALTANIYGQAKSSASKHKIKVKRSSSGDSRLEAGHQNSTESINYRANRATKSRRNNNNNSRQTSPLSFNLRLPSKAPSPSKKTSNRPGLVAPRVQNARKERAGIKATTNNKECHVSPRLIKKCPNFTELLPVKSVTNYKIKLNLAEVLPQKSNLPLSKAQLQKKQLERRKQWR